MENDDYFAKLAYISGCDNISDLRFNPYNKIAKRLFIACFDVEEMPLNVLSDIYEYLYSVKNTFTTYEEAKLAFGATNDRRKLRRSL